MKALVLLSGQITPNGPFGGSTGRAGGRRQVQIVGGGFNGPSFPNTFASGSGDSYNGGFGNTNAYANMTWRRQ